MPPYSIPPRRAKAACGGDDDETRGHGTLRRDT